MLWEGKLLYYFYRKTPTDTVITPMKLKDHSAIFYLKNYHLPTTKNQILYRALALSQGRRPLPETQVLSDAFATYLGAGFLKTPPRRDVFFVVAGGYVAGHRWLVASHRSPVTSHQGFNHQVASHQNGWWLRLVAGGSWLVAGGLWLVLYK